MSPTVCVCGWWVKSLSTVSLPPSVFNPNSHRCRWPILPLAPFLFTHFLLHFSASLHTRSSGDARLALAALYWEEPDPHWLIQRVDELMATLSSPTTDCLRAAAVGLRFISLVCWTLKCQFLPKQLTCCHFMHDARHHQLWARDALMCRGSFNKNKNHINKQWEQSSK